MTESRDPTAPEGVFDGLQLRAIALGVAVDHVASLIFGTALALVLASEELGAEDEAMAEAALEAAVASPEFVISAVIGGTICTVLAAFVGARYAGVHYLRHGAWVAAASAGLAMLWSPAFESMTLLDWLGLLVIVPAGIVGGALARWSESATAEDQREEY